MPEDTERISVEQFHLEYGNTVQEKTGISGKTAVINKKTKAAEIVDGVFRNSSGQTLVFKKMKDSDSEIRVEDWTLTGVPDSLVNNVIGTVTQVGGLQNIDKMLSAGTEEYPDLKALDLPR